jgi:hypothetical protein
MMHSGVYIARHRFLGVDGKVGRTAITAAGQGKKRPQESVSELASLPKEKEARVEESGEIAVTKVMKQVLGTDVIRFDRQSRSRKCMQYYTIGRHWWWCCRREEARVCCS